MKKQMNGVKPRKQGVVHGMEHEMEAQVGEQGVEGKHTMSDVVWVLGTHSKCVTQEKEQQLLLSLSWHPVLHSRPSSDQAALLFLSFIKLRRRKHSHPFLLE